MNKLFFLFFLVLAPALVKAQFQPVGALTVFNEDGDRFFLIINGERQNDVAQTNIRVDELPQPYYKAKIIFEDKTLAEISKDVMIADADGILVDATYRIKKDRNGKRVMRGYSMIPYAQNFAPPPGMYVRSFGRTVPAVGGTVQQTTTVTSGTTGMNTNVQAGGVSMNVTINDPVVQHSTTTTTTTTQSGGWGDATAPQQGCTGSYCMGNGDFSAAKASISESSFDETKLSTAQGIADANCLSADQIADICRLFSFEANKLSFAKSAYAHCTDPRNYFKVNNAFTFDASKRELNGFITGR